MSGKLYFCSTEKIKLCSFSFPFWSFCQSFTHVCLQQPKQLLDAEMQSSDALNYLHTTPHRTAPHRSPPTLLVWKAGVSRCSLMAFWSRLAVMVSPPTPECCCQRVKYRGKGNCNHDTEERRPQHAAWRQMSHHTCTHCQKLTNGHKHFEKTVKKKKSNALSLSLTAPLAATTKCLGVAGSSWRKPGIKSTQLVWVRPTYTRYTLSIVHKHRPLHTLCRTQPIVCVVYPQSWLSGFNMSFSLR